MQNKPIRTPGALGRPRGFRGDVDPENQNKSRFWVWLFLLIIAIYLMWKFIR